MTNGRIPSDAMFRFLAGSRRRALVSAVCLAAIATESVAQQADNTASTGALESVVVTAQRRSENLQIVPVAVTAVTAEQLESRGVQNSTDLSGMAPNFHIQAGRGGGAPFTGVRGIVGINTGANRDNSLAFYVDGVNVARVQGQNFDVADLERVEILLGPQGTLFGRNATAGAINLITKAPTGEFGIKQDVSLYNNDGRRYKTRLDLPAWRGLSASISYLHDEQDGYVSNPKPPGYTGVWPIEWDFSQAGFGIFGKFRSPEKTGGHETDAGLFALKYEPEGIDGLRLDLKFDVSETSVITPAEQAFSFVADSPAAVALYQPVVDAQPGVGGIAPISLTRLGSIPTMASFMKDLDTRGVSLTATYEASDNLTVKNIFGYRKLEVCCGGNEAQGLGGLLDPAGSGAPYRVDGISLSRNVTDSVQDEVQVLVTTESFDLTAGVYFFQEETVTDSVGFGGGVKLLTPPRGSTTLGTTNSNNSSFSVFAQGTWHATDKLNVTLGARQNWDRRVQDIRSVTTAALDGLQPLPPVGTKAVDFENTSYTGILSYQFTPDLMVYLKRSTGYVSGGVVATTGQVFRPEELLSHELGAKWEFWDGRARLNTTAFHYIYEDFQFATIRNSVLFLDNVQEQRIKGLELEFNVRPVDSLLLGLTAGYRQVDFEKYVTPQGDDVTAQQRENYSPKFQGGFHINYDFPTSWPGEPFAQIDGVYRTEINHLSNWLYVPNEAVDRAQMSDPFLDLSARIGLAEIPIGSMKGRVSLWGKNLLNEIEPWAGGSNGVMISLSFYDQRSYGIDFSLSI